MAPDLGMARMGRWMGAVVVESRGQQVLVGNPKEPCTFAPPVPLSSPLLLDDRDPLELAEILTRRLVIERNGSVSERLWRLITHEGATRAQWLVDVPAHVWEIVRDQVLRCS
jgi:hypothetical protein